MILCLTLSEGQGDGTLWHAEKPLTPALSRREVNALCQSIGMRGTMHRHGMPPHRLGRDHPLEAVNVTTPAGVGLLLELILQGTQDLAAADAKIEPEIATELGRIAATVL